MAAPRKYAVETIRAVKRELDKREAIVELKREYTFRAIGARHGMPAQHVHQIAEGYIHRDIGIE
jgi:hypothetical protein